MRMERRREPAQVMALAAVAMVSIVAMIAFVIDASTFFVIRRELQNAADAGALAGAIYLSPYSGVPAFAVNPPPTAGCTSVSDQTTTLPPNDTATQVACYYVGLNSAQASRLCNTTAGFKNAYTKDEIGPPALHVLVVEVSCDAEYSFGRILKLQDRQVSAYAIAGLGRWNRLTGTFGPDLPAIPPTADETLASRLVPD